MSPEHSLLKQKLKKRKKEKRKTIISFIQLNTFKTKQKNAFLLIFFLLVINL